MRTTLNLDDDVAATLADEARKRGTSLSRVANDLLRAGARSQRAKVKLPPYEPRVFHSGKPLMDVTNVAEALDELDRGD